MTSPEQSESADKPFVLDFQDRIAHGAIDGMVGGAYGLGGGVSLAAGIGLIARAVSGDTLLNSNEFGLIVGGLAIVGAAVKAIRGQRKLTKLYSS